MNQSNKLFRAFQMSVLIILIALVLEFIFGMYTALFVNFPDSLVNGNGWEWSMAQSPIIMIHVLLGTLLVVGSFLALGLAIAIKSKTAISTSLVGLVMMGIAYLSGSIFLSNIQLDRYSFAKALGFVGALVICGMAYYLTLPIGQTAS